MGEGVLAGIKVVLPSFIITRFTEGNSVTSSSMWDFPVSLGPASMRGRVSSEAM